MKAFMVSYQIKNDTFKDIVVSDKMRAVRYKLSMKHRCPLKNVKIIDSKVIIDNRME